MKFTSPTHTKTMLFALFLIFASASFAFAQKPAIFYSDLVSGPKTGGKDNKGVFVTIWGEGFGTQKGDSFVTVGGGQVNNYPEWSDKKICFQLGANVSTGSIQITTPNGVSNGVPFTIRNGGIYFVDASVSSTGSGTYSDPWQSPKSFYNNSSAGDTCYFRTGTYGGTYGYGSGSANFMMKEGYTSSGTESKPIAYVAYPGELVVFDALGSTAPTYNFRMWDDGGVTDEIDWHTISKFIFKAYNQCIGSAGTGWRIVGNDCEGITRTTALWSGAIGTGGKSAKIFGNFVHGGRSGSKMDHAIYPGGCPSDGGIEIGWNHIYDNNFDRGPLISINHEGTRCGTTEYVDPVRVYSNIIDATNYPSRCLAVYDMSYTIGDQQETEAYLYNNILIGCGKIDTDGTYHPALFVQNGHAYIYNNTFYNTVTDSISIMRRAEIDSKPLLSATVKNNLIYSSKPSSRYYIYLDDAYYNPITVSNNLYYGKGGDYKTYIRDSNGYITDPSPIVSDPLFINPNEHDFRIPANSAAVDKGALLTTTPFDVRLTPRGQGSGYDIGAYEYINTNAEENSPKILSIVPNQ